MYLEEERHCCSVISFLERRSVFSYVNYVSLSAHLLLLYRRDVVEMFIPFRLDMAC